MRTIHRLLPPMERTLATWLIEVLIKVAAHKDVNHMTPDNLGIVFGPGVFGSPAEELNMTPQQMMDNVEDCKLGKELISELVRYYSENPDKRPLLDKIDNTVDKNKAIPNNNGIRMTFRQSSSLGRLLLSRRTAIEKTDISITVDDNASDDSSSPIILRVPKAKANTRKKQKFQKELQQQFVNGKVNTLHPVTPPSEVKSPRKKSSAFSTLRGFVKNENAKKRKSVCLSSIPGILSDSNAPSSARGSDTSTGRKRKSKRLTNSQKLTPALRRSDSSLDKLLGVNTTISPSSSTKKSRRKSAAFS